MATAASGCYLCVEIDCFPDAVSYSHGCAARNLYCLCFLEGSPRQKQENGVGNYWIFTHIELEMYRVLLIVYSGVGRSAVRLAVNVYNFYFLKP